MSVLQIHSDSLQCSINVPTPSSTHIYVSMINELQKEVAFLKGMAAQSSMAQPIVDLAKETKSDESSSSVDVDFVPAEATKKKDESNEKEASIKKGVTLVELVDRFIQVKKKLYVKILFAHTRIMQPYSKLT